MQSMTDATLPSRPSANFKIETDVVAYSYFANVSFFERVAKLVVHHQPTVHEFFEQLLLKSRDLAESADTDQPGRPFERMRQAMGFDGRVAVVQASVHDRERAAQLRHIVANLIDETFDRFAVHLWNPFRHIGVERR